MSHFAVIVVGLNYEELLAPFQENNMEDCPKQYLEFFDETDEIRQEWETGEVGRMRGLDGQLLSPYDKGFTDGTLSRAHFVEVQVPAKSIFSDFLQYAHEIHGRRPNEEGRLGFWENPNAKWDWYTLGGRWSGFFPLKSHVFRTSSVEGLQDDKFRRDPIDPSKPCEVAVASPEAAQGTGDLVKLKHIDFDKARAGAEERARAEFAIWREAFEAHGRPESWTTVRERHKDSIDRARSVYHKQPALQALRKKNIHLIIDCPVEMLGFDEEKHVERARRGALTPFAFLKDRKWHEKGRMLGFGMAADEKDERAWASEVYDMIESLDPDTWLALVDCHI